MSKRILVVDDTLFMRVKIKGLLDKWGYQVAGEAGNGREAVEKFTELQPDIVLMDITMPEMDGIAALKEIRLLDPKAVVVMVTALGQEEYMIEAVRSGACNYIVKPFQENKFHDILENLSNF